MTGDADDRARDALRVERERTLARIDALARDREAVVESAAMGPVDDEHDPEGVTVGFERAHVEALLRDAREHLAALDRTLERVAAGTYGICAECGRPIGAGRLAARPVATRCIACAAAPSGRRR